MMCLQLLVYTNSSMDSFANFCIYIIVPCIIVIALKLLRELLVHQVVNNLI